MIYLQLNLIISKSTINQLNIYAASKKFDEGTHRSIKSVQTQNHMQTYKLTTHVARDSTITEEEQMLQSNCTDIE